MRLLVQHAWRHTLTHTHTQKRSWAEDLTLNVRAKPQIRYTSQLCIPYIHTH